MATSITETELAELTALLQADPAGAPLAAIRKAVAARPAKAPKPPKPPKAPKPVLTALEQLKKSADNAIAEAARVRALREELCELQKAPLPRADMEQMRRRMDLHSELNHAFSKLADTADYLYTKLRAELDKLPDPEVTQP